MYIFFHHFWLIVGYDFSIWLFTWNIPFKWFGAILQNMAIVKEEQARLQMLLEIHRTVNDIIALM